MARQFSKILRLQMSLNHLCQASRSVVSSADIMTQMLEDWKAIDREMIIKQTRFSLSQKDMNKELNKITACMYTNLSHVLWHYLKWSLVLSDSGRANQSTPESEQKGFICVFDPGLFDALDTSFYTFHDFL